MVQFNTYTPFSLGFDETFARLEAIAGSGSNYPPFNIVDGGNGNFRIYVTGGKYTTPTDAETVFGKAAYWVDYKTREAAQEKINSMVNTEKMKKTPQPITPITKDRSVGMMR